MRILFDWNGENSDRLVSARHKCACLLENKASMLMHCLQTWDTVDWSRIEWLIISFSKSSGIRKNIFKILRNKNEWSKEFRRKQGSALGGKDFQCSITLAFCLSAVVFGNQDLLISGDPRVRSHLHAAGCCWVKCTRGCNSRLGGEHFRSSGVGHCCFEQWILLVTIGHCWSKEHYCFLVISTFCLEHLLIGCNLWLGSKFWSFGVFGWRRWWLCACGWWTKIAAQFTHPFTYI